MSAESNKPKMALHWPTMLLGLIVACIFLIAIFSYQAGSTEWCVVTTLGNITDITGGLEKGKSGLHFRWPPPIQDVEHFDNRLRCFDGSTGKLEQTFTADGINIIIGIYVTYRIENPKVFFKYLKTIPNAEDKLNSLMRTMKDEVIGQYKFNQLVNTDPKKMMLNKIEEQILNGIPTKKGSNDIGSQGLSKIALQKYGLKITNVGIRSLILPEEISKNVFDRMIAERKGIASNYRAEGKRQADTIRAEADSMKSQTIANAEAEAKIIKAEGDAEAAKHYAVFREDPALAIFLRKLDSLKKILGNKTTLVLDTDSAPFDLLKMNSDQLATPAKKVTPNKPKSKPGK